MSPSVWGKPGVDAGEGLQTSWQHEEANPQDRRRRRETKSIMGWLATTEEGRMLFVMDTKVQCQQWNVDALQSGARGMLPNNGSVPPPREHERREPSSGIERYTRSVQLGLFQSNVVTLSCPAVAGTGRLVLRMVRAEWLSFPSTRRERPLCEDRAGVESDKLVSGMPFLRESSSSQRKIYFVDASDGAAGMPDSSGTHVRPPASHGTAVTGAGRSRPPDPLRSPPFSSTSQSSSRIVEEEWK